MGTYDGIKRFDYRGNNDWWKPHPGNYETCICTGEPTLKEFAIAFGCTTQEALLLEAEETREKEMAIYWLMTLNEE